MLAFSVGIALLTGVLFGLSPALQLSRPEVSQVMQSSTRRIAGGVRGKATNNVLIGAQIALTLLMLAGAGAAMEGFLKLLHTPLGYDPHNVMSVGIPVHNGTYKTWAERSAYFDMLMHKAGSVSGVEMVAISTNATPPSNGWGTKVEILGQAAQRRSEGPGEFCQPQLFSAATNPGDAREGYGTRRRTTMPRMWR